VNGGIVRRLAGHLYFWVLVAIVAGGTLGYLLPDRAVALKPLGDGFIALVKMLISPIIFCTVVLGIAGAGDMKKVGRVGAKALIYFELVSTLALGIGLLVMHVVHPGTGFNVDPATLDAKASRNLCTESSGAKYVQLPAARDTNNLYRRVLPDQETFCRFSSLPYCSDMR